MEQLDVQYKTNYGGPELKRFYRKYSALGVVLALAFHFLGVGAYWGSIYLAGDDGKPGSVRLSPPYGEIVLPSSWTNPVAPAVTGRVKPGAGIPIPMPESRVDPNATIAAQTDFNEETGVVAPGPTVSGENKVQPEEIEAPLEYVPYERPPEVVKQVQPRYPDLAARAGLEGTVWVKIWVDKAGKPRKAVVVKTDSEIFNQPATEAALQWVFVPAMMKNGPVSVWVSIPFRFKLQGK